MDDHRPVAECVHLETHGPQQAEFARAFEDPAFLDSGWGATGTLPAGHEGPILVMAEVDGVESVFVGGPRQSERSVVDDGFALFDSEDRLLVWNPAFELLNTEVRDLLVPGRRSPAGGSWPAAVWPRAAIASSDATSPPW